MKKSLTVTITGADDAVDPYQLVHISRFYPFVEWGVLFSSKRRGSARYPSLQWIRELEELATARDIHLAMHLCGAEMRAANGEWFRPGPAWGRVQLNGYEPGTATPEWRRPGSFRWILQARSTETLEAVREDALDADADTLFDPSGGTGAKPTAWPTMPLKYPSESAMRYGFAGGITPDNVRVAIDAFYRENPQLELVWVDMESGVRTDDKFDIDKVTSVLESVKAVRNGK